MKIDKKNETADLESSDVNCRSCVMCYIFIQTIFLCLNYSEYTPHALLAPYVKCFWTLEADGAPGSNAKEKILPDGCTELIFHLGDAYKRFQGVNEEVQFRSFVYGQLTEFIEIAPTGKTGILGIRFFPSGLAAFTRIPALHFTQLTTCLEDFWGSAGRQLEEQIMLAASTNERIRTLTSFLIARLQPVQHPVATHAATLIAVQKGNMRMSALASRLYINERQLERLFLNNVGMSAKVFARICRFQHALGMMQRAEFSSFTDVAYKAGYYDQAHFIRDFKAFAGESPSSYCSGRNELAELFTTG